MKYCFLSEHKWGQLSVDLSEFESAASLCMDFQAFRVLEKKDRGSDQV